MSLALTSRRAALLPGRWVSNELWRRARAVPSLDLRFAENKSLVDSVSGRSLITFTRASTGTYIDSDGVIRSAATNLSLRSQEFDNAAWTKTGSSVSSEATTAPDGTTTADKLIEDSSTGSHNIVEAAAISYTSGVAYTFSFFIKKAERQTVQVLMHPTPFPGTVGQRTAIFNSNTGAFVSVGSAYTGSSATALANGWYRVSISSTADATAAGNFTVSLCSDDAGTVSYTGDGTSGLYLWGAQLEVGSTATAYIPTGATINSAPRFDHDPTTGESLGLLVEEQRTNLLLRSEEFDDAIWTVARSSVTANNQAAPNGTVTADTLTADGTTDFENAITQTTGGFSAAGDKTISAFIKKGTNNFVQIYTGGNVNVFANFDLNTGTIGTVGTQCTAAIASFGNGWYRCVVTTSQTNPTKIFFNIVTSSTAPRAEVGGTSNSIYIWGAQLEAGSFPTSYIPTTSSTVTRSADVATDTTRGAALRSLYAQFRSPASGTRPIISLDDNTANERIELFTSGTDPKLLVTDGGSAQADIDAGAIVANTTARLGTRFNTNNFAASISGGAEVLDTSGTMPTVDRIRIGRDQAGNYLNGTIARITGWNDPLPMLPPVSG